MSIEAAERIKDLERQVALVRKERQQAQRRVAERATVEMALERTLRDRSALTSPAVDEARGYAQRLLDELVECWDGVDRVRHMLTRFRAQVAADFGPIEAALAAEMAVRVEFAAQVELAGLAIRVPVLEQGDV